MALLTKDDVDSLKAYVRATNSGFAIQADSTVRLHVTHSNLKAKFIEIRLDMHATIESVKVKLSFHAGTNPGSMVLQLLDEEGNMLNTLWDDTKKLGFYSPRDGYILHIVDTDPVSASSGGWLEDTSLVEKYKMSDTDYDKRENTYRKWKDQKLKDDPTWTLEREMAARRGVALPPAAPVSTDPEHLAEAAAGVKVGERCNVDPGDRRGEVKFVGKVDGLPLGYWVGVQYDEPLGRSDGRVKGQKIFACPPGYGGFVRPDKVQIGDFPPIDEFASDEDLGEDEV